MSFQLGYVILFPLNLLYTLSVLSSLLETSQPDTTPHLKVSHSPGNGGSPLQLARDHDLYIECYQCDSFFSLALAQEYPSYQLVLQRMEQVYYERGSGHSRVHTCIMITPSEKQSSFFVYTGGSVSASGGM